MGGCEAPAKRGVALGGEVKVRGHPIGGCAQVIGEVDHRQGMEQPGEERPGRRIGAGARWDPGEAGGGKHARRPFGGGFEIDG